MSEATVWLKKQNGKYIGKAVEDGGTILELGKSLLSKHKSASSVRGFIGSAEEVGPSVMRMTAKEHDDGAYVYVFDELENAWKFGISEDSRLKDLLDWLERK